jgi:hypothetical protein
VITREEIVSNVASQVSETVTGVPVNLVQDAADHLLAADGIAAVSPSAASAYVRNCPFI